MKFIYSKIAIVVAGIIIIAAAACLIKYNGSPFHSKAKISPENVQENNEQKLFLTIDGGNGSPQSFEENFEPGLTVFQLLKNKTDVSGIVLESKSSDDYGVFIEKIGDKKNGDEGKYWIYYVNGEMAQVAADKQGLKAGDRVEFKFEKSPF
jgi:hypothetical protein